MNVEKIKYEIKFWELESFEDELLHKIQKEEVKIEQLEKIVIADKNEINVYENSNAFKKLAIKEEKALFLQLNPVW